MTSASADTDMTALHELLEERQRYEGWLRTLEQRKGSTTPQVYDRVHADYTGRLEQVLQRLSERTEQLRGTIDVLQSRLTTLRARETDRIETRQEAELRAAVGEYTDEEWNTLRDDADREIATIAEERRGVEGEMAELQHIMALTRSSNGEGSAAPSPEPEPLSLLPEFVAESRGAEPSTQKASTAAPSSRPIAPPPPVDPIDEDVPLAPAREQEKTLKCPECGAMNYATEWYCERCGGELATF